MKLKINKGVADTDSAAFTAFQSATTNLPGEEGESLVASGAMKF